MTTRWTWTRTSRLISLGRDSVSVKWASDVSVGKDQDGWPGHSTDARERLSSENRDDVDRERENGYCVAYIGHALVLTASRCRGTLAVDSARARYCREAHETVRHRLASLIVSMSSCLTAAPAHVHGPSEQ